MMSKNFRIRINQMKMEKMQTDIPDRLLAIWGRSILSSGWSSIPNELLKNQSRLNLSNTELVLVIHLISFMHHADARVFPSINLLSERMSQDRRTIQRALSKLEAKKIIRKRIRSTSKSDIGMTNIYDLTPLMLKLIGYQIPSLSIPNEEHVCPSCGVKATSQDEIGILFGVRMDGDKKRIQSWCRSCRGKKQKGN